MSTAEMWQEFRKRQRRFYIIGALFLPMGVGASVLADALHVNDLWVTALVICMDDYMGDFGDVAGANPML